MTVRAAPEGGLAELGHEALADGMEWANAPEGAPWRPPALAWDGGPGTACVSRTSPSR